MTKSGWLMLPAAFFLIVNFSVSSVNTRFFSCLVYFLFLIFLFLLLRQFNLDNILPPIIGGVSLILFFYGIIQKFVLFPYYLKHLTPGDNFYSKALFTRVKTGRIFSLFSLPTLYAIICTVLIIFIFHYLLGAKNKKSKIFWGFLLVTGLFNLVLTQSFGGFLYFLTGVLVYLLLSGILKFKYLVPLLMVLSLFLFIIITLRFSEAKELEPVKLRYSNWKQASRIIASAPFLGVGLGNYKVKISYYTFPSEARSMYAHNFFLQFTAETGFIIPCILLLFLLVSRKKLKPRQYKEKIVYIVVVLVLVVYNLIDIGFYFFSAGVTAVIALSQVYPPSGEKRILKKSPKLIMNIIVFALLSFLLLGETISENHRKTADFLDAQKDYQNARQYYQKSFKINPFNYNAMVRYACIELRFNKTRNAEKYLDKALKLYPDLAFANYLQSQIQFKRNNLFKAYYHAAAAYNKFKLSIQYKQWYESIKKNLETLLAEDSRSPDYQ